MTREQIEKAAIKSADEELDDFECRGHRDGFIAGAQWRINSVWHSTDELPQYSGYLAVLMENRIMEVIHYTVGIGFHEMTLKGYVLWAYISDLLPEKKEGYVNIVKEAYSDDKVVLGHIFGSYEDAVRSGKVNERYIATVKIQWEE